LITAILPIITIVSITVSTVLQKAIRNELKSAAYIWALSFIAALALIVVYASNVVLSVIFMGIIAGCMHGVNMMLVSHLPLHFARFGRSSTMTGILNASTYMGSAISIYGFAALSDHFGWKYTIGSWIVILFLGMVICAMCMKKWGRFAKANDLTVKA
jgi:OPA family glycerol-3-phosphate transporter-like MFS transporter